MENFETSVKKKPFFSIRNKKKSSSFKLLYYTIGLTLFSACASHQQEKSAMTQEPLQSSPKIAIAPVIDRTEKLVSWNLSDELTATFQHRFLQSKKLKPLELTTIRSIAKKLTSSHNPFSENLSWIREKFYPADFVVFVELLEHGPDVENPSKLAVQARARIVDIRGAHPKIVFQEMLTDSQFLPDQFRDSNFETTPWGSELFVVSPMGLFHSKFVSEAAKRMEEYIVLAHKQSL